MAGSKSSYADMLKRNVAIKEENSDNSERKSPVTPSSVILDNPVVNRSEAPKKVSNESLNKEPVKNEPVELPNSNVKPIQSFSQAAAKNASKPVEQREQTPSSGEFVEVKAKKDKPKSNGSQAAAAAKPPINNKSKNSKSNRPNRDRPPKNNSGNGGQASNSSAQRDRKDSSKRESVEKDTKTFDERFEEEKNKYLERFKDEPANYCFTLVKGDLFSASEESSLAHCVSEDFSMSRGIATEFKKRYNNVEELLSQNVKVGGCAYLKTDSNRHIFYLVTKRFFNHKPYYNSLEKSLKAMRTLCDRFQIQELAMPMIGTGLDRLEWNLVSRIIDYVFNKTSVKITIYKYENNNSNNKKSYNNNKRGSRTGSSRVSHSEN